MNGYQNWHRPQGYNFTPCQLDHQHIKRMSRQLFRRFDQDGSNELTVNEAAQAIQMLYTQSGRYPSNNDVMFVFHEFDKNNSGTLNRREFKKMIKFLAGQNNMSDDGW